MLKVSTDFVYFSVFITTSKSRYTSEGKGPPYVITHKPTYHPPNPLNPF